MQCIEWTRKKRLRQMKKRRFTSVTRILFSHNVWLQPINWRTALNYTHPSHCQHICIEYNTKKKKSIDLFVNRNIRNDYFASYQVKHNDKNEKNKNFYDEKTWRKRGKKPTKRTNNGPWILFSCRHHVVIIIIKYNDEKKTSRLCCIFILLNIVLVIAKTFIVTTLIEIWVGKKRDWEREQQS